MSFLMFFIFYFFAPETYKNAAKMIVLNIYNNSPLVIPFGKKIYNLRMWCVPGSDGALILLVTWWHEVKNLRAGVKETKSPKTLDWDFSPQCFSVMSSTCLVRYTFQALRGSYNSASMKSTAAKLSGRVHTNAPLQIPYLSHMKNKQRLGALSGQDHKFEFFAFTNRDKRPSSNKTPVQVLLFRRELAVEAAPLNDWWLLKAAQRKELQPDRMRFVTWLNIKASSLLQC